MGVKIRKPFLVQCAFALIFLWAIQYMMFTRPNFPVTDPNVRSVLFAYTLFPYEIAAYGSFSIIFGISIFSSRTLRRFPIAALVITLLIFAVVFTREIILSYTEAYSTENISLVADHEIMRKHKVLEEIIESSTVPNQKPYYDTFGNRYIIEANKDTIVIRSLGIDCHPGGDGLQLDTELTCNISSKTLNPRSLP